MNTISCKDIRSNILYNIDDIKTLSKVCCTDKLSQEICSQKYFWSLYYKKHNLQFPPKDYNTAQEWIKSFTTSITTQQWLDYLTGNIINNINIYNFDILLCLTGDRDKITNFINENVDYDHLETHYRVDICGGQNIYEIYYILYDENWINILNIMKIELKLQDVYILIYNMVSNNA